MDNDTTDSVLGNQGAQDFNGAITGPQTENQSAASTQPAPKPEKPSVPTKPLAESPATEAPAQSVHGQGQQNPGTTPPPSAVDPAAITKAIVDAHVATRRADEEAARTAASAPKTVADLSPEEFNQKYSVVTVTPQHMQAILDQDPAKAASAMNQLIQSAVKQAVLMATDVAQGYVGEIKNEFNPHIQSWQSYQREQAVKRAEEEFYTAHADLKNERELVNEIKDAYVLKVRQGQVKFSSPQEAYNAVANACRTILKRVNPAWNGSAPATGQAPTTGAPQGGPSRQMSAASTAGRTGTGATASKSDGEAVFGESWR